MIKILIVDDNSVKSNKVKETILSIHAITDDFIEIAICKRDATRLLYTTEYDLMILDLVLPIEENGESLPKNGIDFLNEILINPSIKPPIHILGLSGYGDEVKQAHEHFSSKLWNIVEYDSTSSVWEEKLNSIIYHLVKVRSQFIRTSISAQYDLVGNFLEKENFPNTFLGIKIREVLYQLSNIIERSLDVPLKFSNGSKAHFINTQNLRIDSEYDLQNLIHLILRPWIPSVEAENIAIKYDGNTKNADFSIKGNLLIIEAKYIDSTGKKNDTLKTLEGLKSFYEQNANVRGVLFIIMFNNNVTIDEHKIESDFSQMNTEPCTLVKVLENKLPKI